MSETEIFYKRGIAKMVDVFGEITDIDKLSSADIVFQTLYARDEQKKTPFYDRFHLRLQGRNLMIDLTKSEDELFSDMRKNTKYEVNRASKRDDLKYVESVSPTDDELDVFSHFFDQFAESKGIPKCKDDKLRALRDQDALTLSYVQDNSGIVLCYHAIITQGKYGTVLYSASEREGIDKQRKRLVGRANRFLHWNDFLSFKQKGFDWYNFGRIYSDEDGVAEKNINQFKRDFGGEEVREDFIIIPLSLLGRGIVSFYHWRWRNMPEYRQAKGEEISYSE
jgi:hypothetical protein